jgi:hypothetical protein
MRDAVMLCGKIGQMPRRHCDVRTGCHQVFMTRFAAEVKIVTIQVRHQPPWLRLGISHFFAQAAQPPSS